MTHHLMSQIGALANGLSTNGALRSLDLAHNLLRKDGALRLLRAAYTRRKLGVLHTLDLTEQVCL